MRTPHLVALLLATGLAVPAAADAAVLPGASVDGPSADIKEFGNVDIAADGTGGIAYIKAEGGKNRVFVARVSGGVIGAPERADVGVDAIESRPRVAAAPGGKLIVSYLRDDGGGNKIGYSIVDSSADTTWTSDNLANAVGPYRSNDIDINAAGIAYNINTKGANGDVIAFRFNGTAWTEIATPLDQTQGNPAGGSMEQEQPRIATTADGNAVAAWPEGAVNPNEKVWARRITGTVPSAAVEASSAALNGAPHAGALMVDVDVDGTGAAWVAFRENVTIAASDKGRLVVRKLTDTTFGAPQVVDGLGDAPAESVEFPRVDVNPAGQAFVAHPRQLTFESHYATLTTGDTWNAPARLDTTPATQNSRATAAIGDNGAGLFAWVHKPAAGDAELIGRRYDGGAIAAQATLSNPALGSVNGGNTPELAADANGNVLVGYAQDGPVAGQLRISAAIVDAPAPPPTTGGGGGGGGGGAGGGGTDGGGTGGGGGETPADTVAPLLTKLKLSPTKFKAGTKQPSIKTAAKAKTGTTISFDLGEAATIKYTVERRTVTKKRKVKFVKAHAWSQKAAAGASKVRYEGIVKKNKLGVGTYRVTIVATDAAGNKAKAQVKAFKVVKR